MPHLRLGTDPPRAQGYLTFSTVSWNEDNVLLAPELHPRVAFDQMFRDFNSQEARRKAMEQRSVLDAVLEKLLPALFTSAQPVEWSEDDKFGVMCMLFVVTPTEKLPHKYWKGLEEVDHLTAPGLDAETAAVVVSEPLAIQARLPNA